MRMTGVHYGMMPMVQRHITNRTASYGNASRYGSAYGTSSTGITSRYGNTYGTSSTGSTSRYGNTYGTGRTSTAAALSKMDQVYESTKTAAQNVRIHGNVLMNTQERAGKEMTTDVKNFVNDYNAMVEQMKSTGGASNVIHQNQLNSSFSRYKEDLKAVGITADQNGMLLLDEKALANADSAAVKKAFGGSQSFVGEASVRSIYVEADAVSNQASARYSSFGSYAGYGSYGNYSGYNPYSYNPYSSLGGYSPYGSLSSYNMLGSLLNKYF